MTSNPVVRVGDPADVLASIPALLGFAPHDSLVVLVLREKNVHVTMRIDLPLPPDNVGVSTQFLELVRQVDSATAVLLIVVGGGSVTPAGELPHSPLIGLLREAMALIAADVAHALWLESCTAGARWYCYDDTDACSGMLPDPQASALAAAHAEAGLVTYRSREELAAQVAPVADDVLARRSALLVQVLESEPPTARAALQMIREAIAALPEREQPLTDDEIVCLGAALSNHWVRDACLSFIGGEFARAAEQLWLELTRGCPAPHRAEAAALLALFAYARGDGGLASVAIGQAEESCPGHRLSGLVRHALDLGMSPEHVTKLVEAAAEEVRWIMGGHGGTTG